MSVSDAKSALNETKERPILRLKTSQIADGVVGKDSYKNMM